jgi:hypothetical protein
MSWRWLNRYWMRWVGSLWRIRVLCRYALACGLARWPRWIWWLSNSVLKLQSKGRSGRDWSWMRG